MNGMTDFQNMLESSMVNTLAMDFIRKMLIWVGFGTFIMFGIIMLIIFIYHKF